MNRFFDIDRWNEIWQTIARNRKRSIMTALGVFWGIFMLTVMLGAGTGLNRLFRDQLGDMATNTILMQSSRTGLPYQGMPKNRWWRMDNADVEVVRQLPDVLYASAVFWGEQQHCSYEQRKGDYSIMGYSPDYQRIQPQKIVCGRYINEMDMLRSRKVCVIGEQVQRDLFPEVSDPTGKVIRINSSYFTVVGVLRKQNSVISFSDLERTIILPVSLSQQLYGRGNGNRIDMLAVAGRTDVAGRKVAQACREAIFARHQIAPDDEKAMWTMATEEVVAQVTGLFSGVALLTWIVGLGTLLAGIVGVSNIMLVLVKERTQEIGIRRALGAPPAAIIGQILSESFVLTFLAGVVGLAAGVGVLSVADTLFYQAVTVAQQGVEVSWQVSFGTALLSLAILVGGSLLAGIIPAARALSIKAVDAIREE